jgi:hypothetical protein
MQSGNLLHVKPMSLYNGYRSYIEEINDYRLYVAMCNQYFLCFLPKDWYENIWNVIINT